MITSLDNKKVKEWTKLHQKKYRDEVYLLYDEKTILAAKDHGYLKTLIYTGKMPFEFEESHEVSQEVLDKIAQKEGYLFLGVASKIKYCDDYKERVLVLDELQDPLNIGRIFKNASQFGYDSVVLSQNCADFYSEKSLDASSDSLYKLNIVRGDLKKEIAHLKELGFKIYATGLWKDTVDLSLIKKSDKMAFVMGNEGSGVREEIFSLCDASVKIRMHNIDSLNVAMAAAIVMYRYSR